MARFYGSMQGRSGEATRCGDRSSGMQSHTRGWDLGGYVIATPRDDKTDADMVTLIVTGGSNGHFERRRPVFSAVEQTDENGKKTGEVAASFYLPGIGCVGYIIRADGTWERDGIITPSPPSAS